MTGTRKLLQDLLSINEMCGGQMTVENTIRFYEHEMFIESGGSLEDYLESWDDFCEGKTNVFVDKEWEMTQGQSDRLIPSNPYTPDIVDKHDGFGVW